MEIRLDERNSKYLGLGPFGSYLTPSNDGKRAREMGPVPYKINNTVPFVAPSLRHLPEFDGSYRPERPES